MRLSTDNSEPTFYNITVVNFWTNAAVSEQTADTREELAMKKLLDRANQKKSLNMVPISRKLAEGVGSSGSGGDNYQYRRQ